MNSKYFDEFQVGDKFKTRGATLSESQIIDFAMMWDPQHMHIDKAKSDAGMFGGLIASGFHTQNLSFRLFYDLGLFTETNIIGAGLDEIRWLKPVYVNDTLHVEMEVLETRASKSKPDRGSINWQMQTFNQKDELVFTMKLTNIVWRDPALK